MKILIVPNNTSIAPLESALKYLGCDAVQAADATEAWQILQAVDGPWLVLIDWTASGANGPALCRQIRASEWSDAIHIIIMVEWEDGRAIADGLDAGADDYILNPFETKQLHTRINIGLRVLALQANATRIKDLQDAMQTARNVCHDMNQPLQAVSGYAELMMMTTPKDAPFRDTLQRIIDSIGRVGSLMEKLAGIIRGQTRPS